MSQDSFGSSDLCKTLFKNAVDLSQKLADLYRQTKVYSDVTSPQAVLLRGQLKELCLKIMHESPCEYGARAEDFAWRKVFYEPIQLLKKFQRRTQLSNDLGLSTAIKIQVLSAMGFYQNLLISLQARYSLDLRNIVDIPVVQRNSSHFCVVVDKETRDSVIDLVYRALVCLGNLARYQCDYLDDWTKTLPTRYYLQALMLKPDCGLPHNQLALLAGSRIVEGAYHWLLCLCSKEPFLPAKRNLFDVLGRVQKRVSSMRKTPTSSMKAICSQLMAVVYQFLALSDSHRQISEQNLESLRSSSDFALSNLGLYLKKCVHHDSGRNKTQNGASKLAIPSDFIFKLVVVFQALVFLLEKQHEKAGKQNPTLLSLAISISLSLFASVLHFMRDRMFFRTGLEQFQSIRPKNKQEGELSSSKQQKSELKKPRRRKNEIAVWNEFESDENDEFEAIKEEDENTRSEGEPCNTNEDEDDFSISSCESSVGGYESSGEEKNNGGGGGGESAVTKLGPYEAFCEETWSPVLKIICDWINSNRHILSHKNDDVSLWQNYCDLVNVLPQFHIALNQQGQQIRPEIMRHLEQSVSNERFRQNFVLPEDRAVGHFPALTKSHANIEMAPQQGLNRIMTFQEAICLRLAVIQHFSHSMTAEFLDFLPATNRFSVKNRELAQNLPAEQKFSDENSSDGEEFSLRVETKQQQMKAMAELWLKSEITRLEKPSSPNSGAQIPIYACLVGDLFLSQNGVKMVRSLLQSQRLIVALPQALIAHLDAEKTRNEASREASRFIEAELRKGTPYLRIYNQSSQTARISNSADYFGEYRTLPAVFAVVRQLLSENIQTPSISRCLVAVVSSSALNELPQEVERFVQDEMRRLPNGGSCVQFKSIRSLLNDVQQGSD